MKSEKLQACSRYYNSVEMRFQRKSEKVIMSVCLLLFLLFYTPVSCHTMKEARTLLSDKMTDYEKTFRPVANQSKPVEIYFTLELVSIQEFDEVQEKLTVTAVLALVWFDENMRWDPADYGGMTELVVESEKVWTPTLILTNNVDKIEKIGDDWQLIRFTAEGLAYYYPGNVLSSACKVDVTYYPWDRHRCELSFTAWAYAPSEVILKPATDRVQTSYFSENGAWAFYNSSVETFYDLFLSVYINPERKPRFVLVNVILPVIFMAFLNTMIFLIPIESGERISYSITVLLAIAVFLTLVGDNLPKTSSPMSIFSYYLLVVLVVSICITLSTIFNVRLYYTDDSEEVSGRLARFYRCMNCSCRRKSKLKNTKYKKRSVSHGRSNMQQKQTSKNFVLNGTADSVISDKNIYYPSRQRNVYLPGHNWSVENADEEVYSERQVHSDNVNYAEDVSWKDVSAAFDKLFFIISLVILITATTVLFLLLLLSDRPS